MRCSRIPASARRVLKLAEAYMQAGDPQSGYREYVRASDLLPDNNDVQLKAATFLLAVAAVRGCARAGRAGAEEGPEERERADPAWQRARGPARFRRGVEARSSRPCSSMRHRRLRMRRSGPSRRPAAASRRRKRRSARRWPPIPSALTSIWRSPIFCGPADGSARRRRRSRKPWSSSRGTRWRTARLATFYLATRRAPEAERYLQGRGRNRYGPCGAAEAGVGRLLRVAEPRRRSHDAPDAAGEEPRDRDGRPHAPRGARVRAQGSRGRAIEQIDAVLATDPRDVPALLVKARFLLQDGKTGDALARVRTAIGIDPSSVPGALPARIDSPPARRHRPRDGGVQ